MESRLERLDRAIEVTAQIISGIRSRIHPYTATLEEGVWVVRDEPGNPRPRNAEILAVNTDPEHGARVVELKGVGKHFLCDIAAPESDGKARKHIIKELGYRAVATEWVYDHDLIEIPTFKCPFQVRELLSEKEFRTLDKDFWAARSWIPGTRLFAALEGDQVRGWVYSCPVLPDAWVRDLYVHRSYRDQGIGKALMSALMQSDRQSGIRRSILIGSRAGSRIYPQLGYDLIGVMQIFSPIKR